MNKYELAGGGVDKLWAKLVERQPIENEQTKEKKKKKKTQASSSWNSQR